MRKSTSRTVSRRTKAGIALASAAALVAVVAAPAFGVAAALTLSSASGPSGGTNTLTATAPTAIFPSTVTPAVEFQYVGLLTAATCSATYSAAAAIAVTSATPPVQTAGVIVVPAANVKKLLTTKISVTVPSTLALATGQSSANYNMCVYSGTTTGSSGSPLIANAAYKIAAQAVLTSVSPPTGPALGNTPITVVGQNFPATGMTATLGGVALAPSSIVVASNGNSFTAITPPHAASGPLTLSVTTPGGTTNKVGAFSYTNGIVVIPNTGPNTGTTDVDVSGVGFSAISFTTTGLTTPDDANGHVYLVNGTYSPTGNTTKTNGEVTECNNVLVVSDVELICTLTLTRTLTSAGAIATVASRTVTDGVTTNASTTVTSAAANFTSLDVGMPITATGIPVGAVIASVTSPTTAVLSAAATATGSSLSTVIGGPRSVATGATTSGSAALVGTKFDASDVGRQVTGTGIPAGTTITAYTSATAVTMSNPATATASGLTIVVDNLIPVPIDTYTITVVSNGGPGVEAGGLHTDADYTQSIVSSGSTFTVSDY
ncbi:MAG: Hepatocyte growth factor receptor [Actinomycetia bacterium]|nr:Hepatocyte growth factor receptor [Actinomycetes bacterium]